MVAEITIKNYNTMRNIERVVAMSDANIKVTYSLPTELVDELRLVVREGAAPSYSAFVEDALRDAVKREREKLLEQEFFLFCHSGHDHTLVWPY